MIKEETMASKYDMLLCTISYSGNPDEDLNTFHSTFIDYVKLRDFTDAKVVLALRTRLQGNDRVFLDSVPVDQKDSVDKIVKLLKHNFEGDAWKWNIETKLLAKKQKTEELLDSYVTDIIRWCNQLKKTDTERLSLFVRGLKPSIRAFVFSKQPKTFNDALDAARLAVAVNETANYSLPTNSAKPVIVNAIQNNALQTSVDQLSELMVNTVDRLDKLEKHQQRSYLPKDRPMSYR